MFTISPPETSGIYCPVSAGMVFSSITATGIQTYIYQCLYDIVPVHAPTNLKTYCIGGVTYLSAQVDTRTEMLIEDLHFFVKGNYFIH